MHRIFQRFIDSLATSINTEDFREAMAEASSALDLRCFAYLSLPDRREGQPQLISTYPVAWTTHYLRNRYERYDPVISRMLINPEPFRWGLETGSNKIARPQQELLSETAQFGIRYGFTIPIHDGRGPVAGLTFATDECGTRLQQCSDQDVRVLQLMALFFHAHVRRKLAPMHTIDGVILSPREFECLEWATQGKSAWDIGRILGISRHTAATYLENAETKLSVRTIVQAVARLVASSTSIAAVM
jgi:LuxR family transcriptional activator of conjugal transfer of Ti plasmids